MQLIQHCEGPVAPTTNPTTSFLTATTLIYAIGAGITAAAMRDKVETTIVRTKAGDGGVGDSGYG